MVRFGFFWSFLSELQRSHVAQRAVGTDVIVLPSPVFDHRPGPGKSPELFAIQALFPKAGVEALQVSILPWASRLDLESLDPLFGEPAAESALDELRAVIAADVIGRSMALDQRGHDPPDLAGVYPTVHVDA